MLSRLFDPADAPPRDPIFWLVAAAIAAVQLLAFYAVCSRQVQQAGERPVELVALRQAVPAGCLDPTSADCAAFHGPGAAANPVAVAPR